MSDKKEGREKSPPPPTTCSSKDDHELSKQKIKDHQPPPLFLPPFDFEATHVKRPRYTSAQWRPISSSSSSQQPPTQLGQMGIQNPDSSPSSSNPQAQFPSPSPDTSSSPSLSPIPSSSAQQEPITTTTKPDHQQHQLRKGKYVSPVWKPHEMLWLARAWRAQYQGDGPGPGPGPEVAAHGGGTGRGKTRAEKDREVAEFLNRHGVSRDAKTAGTKWDNMLGEFRKVYEWERGGEREQVGKSYFRLSPYERKIHRLPASFDEEVFEELCQFMGPRMRPSSTSSPTSLLLHHHHHPHYHHLHHHQGSRSFVSNANLSVNIPGEFSLKALPAPPLGDQLEDFPLSGRTRQMESYMMMQNPRNAILGFDPHSYISDVGISPSSSSGGGGGSRAEIRRIGKMRLTWEESVSLWAEEGEFHRGRLKVQPSGLLNADELIYFDDSMVASVLEAFEEGPLKGFSVDRFVPGQQLKVFGRRKSPSSSVLTSSTGFIERVPFPMAEPSTRWEFQDPTEYYLGCLKVPPTTLPSLFELSWYLQEPPPEELRLPLCKDIFRDLPQGKDLFFTTCSNEPLDCKSFTIEILSSLIRSNPSISASTSTTRDSYIALWDDCINRVISKFCPLEMVFVRKQSKPSNSEPLQDQWPNITGMVKNLCLWRGEEVDQIRESQPLDPSSTLMEKISWTYNNNLPYVFGYYAIGYNITFCALSPSTSPSSQDKPRITRTDLYSLDLSNPSDRLKSLIPCWRIGVLLASLAEKSTINNNNNNCYSDFERQDQGNGGEIIEMTPNTLTKFYPNKRKWQAVKEIYGALDQRVPHVEQITSHNELDLSLVFKPRGVQSKPKNCEQLVLALKQVTKALVALHDLSFMHRDISWDKVLKNCKQEDEEQEEEEWFISGFDTAVVAPQINPGKVEGERHAPEMGRGVHGVKVDVWGIGYLVRTSGVVRVTRGSGSEVVGWKQLRELEVRCMEHNPEQRPTAADCYHHLLQIQSSLSTAAVTAAVKGASYS